MYIFILCVLVALVPDFSRACGPDPSKWTPQERQMYECLKAKGWSDDRMRDYYNRVFKPETRSGRASSHDQYIVRGCLTAEDFLHYGVIPDGYYTTTTTTTQVPVVVPAVKASILTGSTPREQKIFDCLKAKGWTDAMIQKWFDRVLNPATRTGRATQYDQDLVLGCVDTNDYLYYGVTPDGYTPPASPGGGSSPPGGSSAGAGVSSPPGGSPAGAVKAPGPPPLPVSGKLPPSSG